MDKNNYKQRIKC